jgi:hypothetical protein
MHNKYMLVLKCSPCRYQSPFTFLSGNTILTSKMCNYLNIGKREGIKFTTYPFFDFFFLSENIFVWFIWLPHACQIPYLPLGHFTREPRAVTMKLWEPNRKCSKAVPTHLQNHVAWSQTLECSVKAYVSGPLTKCYINEFLLMRVLTHDKIEQINSCKHSKCHGLPMVLR